VSDSKPGKDKNNIHPHNFPVLPFRKKAFFPANREPYFDLFVIMSVIDVSLKLF